MKRLVAFLLFAALPAGAQVSQFKGWAAVGRELSTRLAPAGAKLPMDKYLPAPGLNALLGTWDGFGAVHVYQNGLPNPLNMLIWQTSLKAFARDTALACGRGRPPAFNAGFRAVLQAVCRWPAAAAMNDETLTALWLYVMGYNAPESEFEAWREFFKAQYAAKPAGETVEAMILTITMNPYFLLHR